MAILPLVTSPDPLLKKISEPVALIDTELRIFMDNMLETMYYNEGLGLAAVQVGVLKRILVMDFSKSERDGIAEEAITRSPFFVINPEIIWKSAEKASYAEGCLSFPSAYLDIERPSAIKLRYMDYFGKQQEIDASGLLAVCIQHEIDHLNGVVFVDHVSKLKKDMALKRVEKYKKSHKI